MSTTRPKRWKRWIGNWDDRSRGLVFATSKTKAIAALNHYERVSRADFEGYWSEAGEASTGELTRFETEVLYLQPMDVRGDEIASWEKQES